MNTTLPAPQRPRWMIVDDERLLLQMVTHLLRRLDEAEVCPFASPQDALRMFEGAPQSFELVVVDRHMPDLDGVEFTRRLHACAPGLKVILATGDCAGITEADAHRMGFEAVLPKPFTAAQLEAAVHGALSSHGTREAAVSLAAFGMPLLAHAA